MKKVAILLLICLGVLSSIAKDPIDLPACALNAWSPEIFTLYGDVNTVTTKLGSIDRDLLKHRTFAFVVDSAEGSQLFFFEGDTITSNKMELSKASGEFQQLANQISSAILENKGDKCSGMLAKNMIQSKVAGISSNDQVSKPASIKAAFDMISGEKTGYVRVSFILLC